MKDFYPRKPIRTFLFASLLLLACVGQEKPSSENSLSKTVVNLPWVQPEKQIAQYIRNIQEDKNGKLWFGTNGYGVAHYNGDSLVYFSNVQGFNGGQITGITEDTQQNLWFATDQGIVKYEWTDNSQGMKLFTNYSASKYFQNLQMWSIYADRKGNIWAGSANGIYRFDGMNWAPFELPYMNEAEGDNFMSTKTTWGITEDKAGNIWFSTNGEGVFKFDSESFTQYTKADGLADDHVDHIMEDSKGNIWFGTRYGGVSRYDGKTFTNYNSSNSIGNDEVCVIYEDRAGYVWFSSEGYGLYRYDPSVTNTPVDVLFGEVKLRLDNLGLKNYFKNEGLQIRAVQSIFEDSKGRFWVGGGDGLYRFDHTTGKFVNVTKNGPWE